MKRKRMETAVFWLIIIGPCLIGIASLAGLLQEANHIKMIALWFAFSGAVMVLLAGTIQVQQYLWVPANPPKAAESTAPNPDRPLVLPPDVGMIYAGGGGDQPIHWYMQFRIENFGQAPAVMRMVQGTFRVLELPLTKEKVGAPGQTEVQSWVSSSTIRPGRSVDAGHFMLPRNIQIISSSEGPYFHSQPHLEGAEQLFLFLTTEFDDLSGDGWISHTCWKYEQPSTGAFARYGGKDWNYEEKRP
jgi:hypothetical protein